MRALRFPPFPGRHRARGLAAVEFAIILPVVLLILLATAEFGRALYQYNALTKSVRDGARHLSSDAYNGTTGVIDITAAKQLATRNLVVYGNVNGAGSPLLPGFAPGQVTVTAPDAQHVEVTVAYPYQPIFASLPGFGAMSNVATNFTLSAATSMRAL